MASWKSSDDKLNDTLRMIHTQVAEIAVSSREKDLATVKSLERLKVSTDVSIKHIANVLGNILAMEVEVLGVLTKIQKNMEENE
jgi:hypothetical protein